MNLRGLPLAALQVHPLLAVHPRLRSRLQFVDDQTLVGGGYDMDPLKLSLGSEGWAVDGHLDTRKKAGNTSRSVKQLAMDKAARGGHAIHEHDTTHENTITCMRMLPGDEPLLQVTLDIAYRMIMAAAPGQFTTSGLDGRLVFWNVGDVADAFANLKLESR